MNWSVQSERIQKQNSEKEKERVNFLIDKDYRKRFKQLCKKRGWIMSVIVENNIKRLINSIEI